ncbi:MAG TPA: hypothetical protein VFX63_16840, partial [Pyrinomonadaceae bacterium]|nr:hypothetical protein [Pyrinomonadaceae bacterium]
VEVRAGVVCRAGGGALGAGFVVRMFAEIDNYSFQDPRAATEGRPYSCCSRASLTKLRDKRQL